MKLLKVMGYALLMYSSLLQAEPVDKNFPGPYLAGGVQFGQSYEAGADVSPGTAISYGLDLGYVIKRDTWDRVEFGLELGSASMTYKTKGALTTKVELEGMSHVMLKLGYGYSIGDNVFANLRLGAGLASCDYTATIASLSASSKSIAVFRLIAWDIVYPLSDSMDFLLGANMRMYNTSVDEILGVPVDSFQTNFLSFVGQVRLRL